MGARHKLCRVCHGRASAEGAGPGPTLAELDALVAARSATLPPNDEEPAPPPDADAWWARKKKDAGPRPGDLWETWAGIDHARDGCEFHPDTEPAAIAAAQRAAVAEALAAEPGAGVGRLSELAVLPVWNVERCLEDLGPSRPSGKEPT